MKYILLILIITLVGCKDPKETDFYLCNDQSKKYMREFITECIDKGRQYVNVKIIVSNQSVQYTSYQEVVSQCAYSAKKMFCFEPLRKYEEKDED